MIYFIIFALYLVSFLLLYLEISAKGAPFELVPRSAINNFCILIPARNESRVIRNILESIKNQSTPVLMQNVIIIVAEQSDPTITIAKEYGASVYVRKNNHQNTKGYAIKEVIDYLFSNNIFYDLYFIFDADNKLDPNYISYMLEDYKKGYDIAFGYRRSSNINENKVSACSGLTFTMINTLINESRMKDNQVLILSGTGYFISGDLMRKWGTFPFNSLTEDYELTLYATLHKYKTSYNKNAIFYDEQPSSMNVSMTQRTRWCKGYLETRKEYKLKLKKNLKDKTYLAEYLGITPFLIMIFTTIFLLLVELISFIFREKHMLHLFMFFVLVIIIYLILMIITSYMLKKDNNMLGLDKKTKSLVMQYNPIFLASYIKCIFEARFGKVDWEVIEHLGNNPNGTTNAVGEISPTNAEINIQNANTTSENDIEVL